MELRDLHLGPADAPGCPRLCRRPPAALCCRGVVGVWPSACAVAWVSMSGHLSGGFSSAPGVSTCLLRKLALSDVVLVATAVSAEMPLQLLQWMPSSAFKSSPSTSARL